MDNSKSIIACKDKKEFYKSKKNLGKLAKQKRKYKWRKETLVSKTDSNPLICGECGKLFSNKGSLHLHKKNVHEGITYSCDKCNYKATQKGHLKVHLESIHEGMRYSCDKCDYFSSRKDILRTHRLKYH